MSSEYFLTALLINESRSRYLLRNRGLKSLFIPSMSCDTRTWPSRLDPAPIPIIGIFVLFSTSLESMLGIFSRTKEKQPISSSNKASSINTLASSYSFALTLYVPSL